MSKKTIAIVGNPNSGKTTLFNQLTGLRYKVANYPGVTIDEKSSNIVINDASFSLIDLPGIYSLEDASPDQAITLAALKKKPDLVLAVVDASNLERHLFLVSELLETGLPVILILNMYDKTEKLGIRIAKELLSKELNIPVVAVSNHDKKSILDFKNILGNYAELAPNWNSSQKKDQTPESRYAWAKNICSRCQEQKDLQVQTLTQKIDKYLLHDYWGLLIFLLIMASMFQSVFVLTQLPTELIDSSIQNVSNFIKPFLTRMPILQSLVVDGVITGVGSVLVFIPQIAALFFLLGILEQTGYLARAACVMDRPMRLVGLQGRSFIPLLSCFGCAIPGILSTRTIPSKADRLCTIFVAPLMSCSARIPVYTLLISAFVPKQYLFGFASVQGLVMLGLYSLGIFGAAFFAIIIRHGIFHSAPSLFAMELPDYSKPKILYILREVWDRVLSFIKGAGTTILACSLLIWFLASFPRTDIGSDLSAPPSTKESYAGMLGTFIEPVIAPLGFNWEVGVALLASFAAREVFVSSLATVYSLGDSDDEAQSLTTLLTNQSQHAGGLNLASAISLLIFFAFACQCMSTLAAARQETGSWKLPALMFTSMMVVAYVGAWVGYRVMLWAV